MDIRRHTYAVKGTTLVEENNFSFNFKCVEQDLLYYIWSMVYHLLQASVDAKQEPPQGVVTALVEKSQFQAEHGNICYIRETNQSVIAFVLIVVIRQSFQHEETAQKKDSKDQLWNFETLWNITRIYASETVILDLSSI